MLTCDPTVTWKSCFLGPFHTGQQCRHVRCGLRSAEGRRWGIPAGPWLPSDPRCHLANAVTYRSSPSRTASPAPLGLGSSAWQNVKKQEGGSESPKTTFPEKTRFF